MKKKKSKKLVMDYSFGENHNMMVPKQYSHSKHVWLCEIIVKFESYVDSYEIHSKNKTNLLNIFKIAQSQLNDIDTDGALDYGFRIYRLV